jgi:hypothetical protein
MLSRSGDFSKYFFLGFYLEGVSAATSSVGVRDSSGTTILGSNSGPPLAATNGIPFWPVGTKAVCWLPNEDSPQIAAEIALLGSLQSDIKAFIICVPELAQAGLDISRVSSIELTLGGTIGQDVKVTELYGFRVPDNVVLPPASYGRREHRVRHYSNGLVLHEFLDPDRPDRQLATALDWRSVLMLGSAPVGFINSRSVHPYYPTLVLFDSSGDLQRPLYRLAAEDGRFMSFYEHVNTGDTHVYTLESGFATPSRETYRAGVLDDELSPGVLAFGRNYDVVIPLAKGNGPVANALARLRNRCVASVFGWGGTSLGRSLWTPTLDSTSTMARPSKAGALEARDINGLPTLAEALLISRQVPWETSAAVASAGATTSETRNDAVRLWLTELSRLYSTNSILPTYPGTAVARFVDTTREAALIELAVKVREPVLAGQMLSFYWGRSQGGKTGLHASYDASTGASLEHKPHYSRPVDSEVTASAQLSVAQAAFCLGTATGDRNALELGSNLVQLLLSDFRSRSVADSPRGLSEQRHRRIRVVEQRDLTLWPKANTFPVGCNARAFLLFSRLYEQADTYAFGSDWKATMLAAALEQAAWLTNRVLPHAQIAGIVPQGMFEFQNVHDRTTTLALDRWTTTDDWLAFVEALAHMGFPTNVTTEMLDNLARAHGAEINGIWGLDWRVPLQRPDAISTALTSKFQAVAAKVGHAQAANFARQNLARLAKGESWPIAHTATEPEGPLKTGDGSLVHPGLTPGATGAVTRAWPASPAYGPAAFQGDWPTNLRGVAGMSTPEKNPPRDITQFVRASAIFYLTIVATAVFWWILAYVRHRRRAKLADSASAGLLVSDLVMRRAEERWAKRVLGLREPAGTAQTRYSNAAVEQNFLIQLRAIHKLTLEWRRVINGWAEDDTRLAEDGTDEWLNGLDEFCAMVGIYTRWVIKAGHKDGLQKQDVLHENEDSNHLWARLVMFFSEVHARLLKMMSEFKANPAAAAVLGLNDQIELVLRTMGLRARPAPFDAR